MVTDYSAEYWLLSTDQGKTSTHLAYTQDITLSLLMAVSTTRSRT